MSATPKSSPNTCQFVKPSGSRCRAHSLHNSQYCFFHSPETVAAREAAREAGGRERTRKAAVLPATTPDQRLDTASDVIEMLTVTANQVRRGAIDAKIGSNIGYLCGVALTAMKQAHLESRVRRLEAIIAAQDIAIDPEPAHFVTPQEEDDSDEYDDPDEGAADEDTVDDEVEEGEDNDVAAAANEGEAANSDSQDESSEERQQ